MGRLGSDLEEEEVARVLELWHIIKRCILCTLVVCLLALEV